MKRINDLHACLLVSLIVHAGLVCFDTLHFASFPEDKPFEIAFEVEEELLPKQYEIQEEKKIEPPVIEEEDILEPVPDEILAEKPEPVQDDEELKKSLLRYQDSIKQKIQREKQYPRWALRARHQGVARLEFDVVPSGDVEKLRLVQSSGFNALDAEALDAVKRAKPFSAFPEMFKHDKIKIKIEVVFTMSD